MAAENYIKMCVCAFKEKSSIPVISGKEQAVSIMAGKKIAMTFIEVSTIIILLYLWYLIKTKPLSLNRSEGQHNKT